MRSQSTATIISSTVIHRQVGRYIGWPCVTRTPDNALLVVFSGDREAHTCPYGKTQMIRSVDDGQIWSAPETINDTPLDDRDAGIAALRDGTLLLRWFTVYYAPDHDRHKQESWREFVAKIGMADVKRWVGPTLGDHAAGKRGHWLRRSLDDGQTWEAPMRVVGTSPKPPIELHDGRLLMIGNNGYDRQNRTSAIVVEESDDQGASWSSIATLPMFPAGGGYLGEPDMVETAPGHVIAMARHAGASSESHLYQAESADGGRTWSPWRQTAIAGFPPHLLRLRDARILVTYGYRDKPYGQRACLSADGGKTWDYDDEIVLRADAPNADLGYPASVELHGGTILTVYYQQDKPGEKTSLMATHWSTP